MQLLWNFVFLTMSRIATLVRVFTAVIDTMTQSNTRTGFALIYHSGVTHLPFSGDTPSQSKVRAGTQCKS